MHSAVNLKMGSKEDRPLLSVLKPLPPFLSETDVCHAVQYWRPYSRRCVLCRVRRQGWVVLPQSIGPVAKVQRRSGSLYALHLWALPTLRSIGKYLLERERLVKDNAWTLDG